MACLEQIRTIDKSRLWNFLGRLTDEQMEKIDDAIRKSLGIYIPETVEAP
jgi:mRNA interferase MazF